MKTTNHTKPLHATAQVFITALKALPRRQRDSVLAGLASDPEVREDLIDLAIAAERRKERSRPFKQFLKSLSR